MDPIQIVILGAGYAGIRTARRLIAKGEGQIELTLIDKQADHVLQTNLHEVASGRVRPDAIRIPLARIFNNQPIRLVRDEITAIDFDAKRLTGRDAAYPYDYLVLAAGSSPEDKVPGAGEYSLRLDSVDSAARIKASLDALGGGRVVICGGGLTGVETAGDIKAMYPQLDVAIVQSRPVILADLAEDLQGAVSRRLEKMGVRLITDTQVTAIRPNTVEAVGPDGPVEFAADLIIYTVGIRPRQLSAQAQAGPSGRLSQDEYLRLPEHPFVFAAGDNADGGPATVENGHRQAESIAANLLRSIKGEPLVPFRAELKGLMISTGPGYGFTATKVPLSGWPAVVLKFLVDLWYVFTLGGPGTLVRYFNSHLVEIGHRRTLLGGLLASRGQRLWLFPLRLYVGALWLSEGYKKVIGPQNFNSARSLADYFRIGRDSWLREGNLMIPFDWLRQSDAVSGATMAGTKGPLLEELPLWYEALMRTIMPTTTLAMFFQTLLVVAELAVGVGLLLGLLTWLFSVVSAGLTVNFILSGLGGWEMAWLLPASIALMAGAGQFLGLDYLLIPWLRRTFGADPGPPTG